MSKDKYVVRIFRKDGEVFDTLVSESFGDCEKEWEHLHTYWNECHTEKKVFLLKKPILTAFEPGLIGEISLLPYSDSLPDVADNNPYKQEMKNKGLGDSLRGVGRLI